MKKNVRALSLLLIPIIALLSCSGCVSLTDMRNHQAVYTGNNSILYNNAEYIYIAGNSTLKPPVSDTANYINVTSSDVPLLLSEIMGDTMYVSTDERFLVSDSYSYDMVYCRSDCYNDIMAHTQQAYQPDGYCYSYEIYHEDTLNSTTAICRLTDVQADTIRKVLTAVKGETYSYLPHLDYSGVIELETCTQDLLFRSHVLDIYVLQTGYCLVQSDETNNKITLYPIPTELSPAFADIAAPYLEQEASWNELYGD